MFGVYDPSGRINVTVVDGLTRTGFYASDTSWNIIPTDGVIRVGTYHPCGAIWVTDVTDINSVFGAYAPDGSLYVTTTNIPTGALRVTVVSGSLNPSSGFFFLLNTGSHILLDTGSRILRN